MSGTVGVHNSPKALAAKVALRRFALDWVGKGSADVFDAFCGPVGEMWSAVWREARSYVGCDLVWEVGDPRRRFAADSRDVMRSIDLGAFNVFDFDAFGSPWGHLAILMKRRRFTVGERGALVTTDGVNRYLRYGKVASDMQAFLPNHKACAPSAAIADDMQAIALRNFVREYGIKVVGARRAIGRKGGQAMVYQALAFEGATP